MSQNEKKKNETPTPPPENTAPSTEKRSVPNTAYHRSMPILLFALALVTTLSLIKDGSLLGIVGNYVHNGLFGLFGGAAYLVPFFLATMAFTRRRDIENRTRLAKWIMAFLFTLMIGVLLFVFGVPAEEQDTAFLPETAFKNGYLYTKGGGVLGSLLAYGLHVSVATVGTVIVFIVVTLLFFICYFGFDPRAFLDFFVNKCKEGREKGRIARQKKKEEKARRDAERKRLAEEKAQRRALMEAERKAARAREAELRRAAQVKTEQADAPMGTPRREEAERSPFADDPDDFDVAPPFTGARPQPFQPQNGANNATQRLDIDGTIPGGTITDYPLDNDIFFTDPDSSSKMQPLRPNRGNEDPLGIDTSYDYMKRDRGGADDEKSPRTLSDFARITTTAPAPTSFGVGYSRENVGDHRRDENRPLEGENTTASFFRASGRHAQAAQNAAARNVAETSAAEVQTQATASQIQVSTTEHNAFGNVTQYTQTEPSSASGDASESKDALDSDVPLDLPPWETGVKATSATDTPDGGTLPPSKNPAVFKNPYLSSSVSPTPEIDTHEYSRSVGQGTAKPEPPSYSPFATPAPTRTENTKTARSASTADEPVARTKASDTAEERAGFDFSRYRYPDISFLTPPDLSDSSSLDAEVEANMEGLIRTLKSYGVEAQPRSTTRGPRITRYEIVPALGVRINAITNLQNEIAMNLRAESLRIEAPIPGDSAIGIEVPNKTSKPVRLRALIDTDAFRRSPSSTTVALGADIAGNQILASIAEMPHLLVAGATGMGKSVCINTLITSLLYKARPDEVRLILVDPKMVEFNIYQGIPHLLVPVINNAKQALGALNWAAEEMDRRFSLISKAGVRDLDGYTAVRAQNPEMEPLPRIIIVIDELNDLILSLKNSKPLDDVICRIAQKARAAGVHLILGTQRPTVNVLTGNIKANIPARIAFKVAQKVDSTTIIDCVGAEKLLDKGDMLYMKSSKMRRIQCCLVGSKEIEKIVSFLRANNEGDTYDHSAMAGIDRATSAADQEASKETAAMQDAGGHVGPEERKFWEAVDLAAGNGKIATSLLQRKLSIGYGKAAKLIDKMEELGIVSAQDERKPREILLSTDEINELRARLAGRALFSVGDDEEEDAEE